MIPGLISGNLLKYDESAKKFDYGEAYHQAKEYYTSQTMDKDENQLSTGRQTGLPMNGSGAPTGANIGNLAQQLGNNQIATPPADGFERIEPRRLVFVHQRLEPSLHIILCGYGQFRPQSL